MKKTYMVNNGNITKSTLGISKPWVLQQRQTGEGKGKLGKKEDNVNLGEFTVTDHDGSEIVRKPVDPSYGVYKIKTPEYHEEVKKLIEEHNQGKENATFALIFPDYETAHFWMGEASGQISDGKYENTSGMFDRNHRFYDAYYAVDPSVTPGIYRRDDGSRSSYGWQGRRPSFRDLMWLFTVENNEPGKKWVKDVDYKDWPVDKMDIRNILSQATNTEIKKIMKDMSLIFE